MKNTIDNTDDLIDSRDVIERIEEIEALINDIEEQASGDDPTSVSSDYDGLRAELKDLKDLAKEGEDYSPDWEHGAILIRDSYFEDYAREMLEDCGDIPKDLPHYIAVDWDQTALNIRVDYTPIDFGGVTYWVR